MKRITIRDLAKMLQLSPSTISRALSDHPDISEDTKRRVVEIAEQFNYSVNLHSSFFRNKKSNLIALIIPEMNMFYIPSMINAINDYLYSTEYSLFVFISKDKLKREKQIIKQCVKWAVEGVLIIPSNETKNLEHLDALPLAGIETVVLDKVIKKSKFPSVSINNVDASLNAVDYLLQKGHKKVLGIFGNPNVSITTDRINGYKKAHKKHQVVYKKEDIITISGIDELDSILPVIFNHNKSITAIFCMSDEILSKVNYHIMKFGKRISEDISLISISDGIYPLLAFPKISFVKDSGRRMGKNACSLLINLIDNKEVGNLNLQLDTKLIELDSVKKIIED